MNGDLFEGWLESVFVPCLESPLKSLLVIYNASHLVSERNRGPKFAKCQLKIFLNFANFGAKLLNRKGNIQEIADEYGFSVIFLPKYSPDLNPIEISWANVKNKLRLSMRLFDSFWDALCHTFK